MACVWSTHRVGASTTFRTPFFVDIGSREAARKRLRHGIHLLEIGRAGDVAGHFEMVVYVWERGGVFVAQQPADRSTLYYVGPTIDVLFDRMAHESWEPGVEVGVDWCERVARMAFGDEHRIQTLRASCAVVDTTYDETGIAVAVFGPPITGRS